MLPDVDGRSGIARRFRDIASAILVDQGGGGSVFGEPQAACPPLRCRGGLSRADGSWARRA